VKVWNDAFALEAFFTELSRRAAALSGDERTDLQHRIESGRDLMGGRDAVERFLEWSVPADANNDADDEESADGEPDEDCASGG
jgi:hypothetical protein